MKLNLFSRLNFIYLNFSRTKTLGASSPGDLLLPRSLREIDRTGRSVMCSSRQDSTGHARTASQSAQASNLACDARKPCAGHVPTCPRAARARLPATRYDRSIIFFVHTRPIRDRSMRHAWSSIHDFVQRRSRLVLTYMQWRLELRVCRRRSREAVESTATIVPRPRYIIFFLR
jgi:hypothetical protein